MCIATVNFIIFAKAILINMNSHLKFLSIPFLMLFSIPLVLAQPDEEEEDYSSYGTESGVKRYCTPKVVGLSPQRLVSVGYDFAGPHDINASSLGSYFAETGKVKNYQGLYLAANLPVISTHKFLMNIGMNYVGSNFSFANDSLSNPFLQSLNGNLRTFGLNTTIFKPLNEKNYVLAFLSGDYNGDYNFNRFQDIKFLKTTVVGVFGWKFHERFQFGFGATQTYRAGEKSFLPVIHYNFTSKNDKWGIEALLPARMHYRYAFTRRDLLLAGFEVIGNSYHLANINNRYPDNNASGMISGYDANNLEFRRSEVRFRLEYFKQLSDLFPSKNKSDQTKVASKIGAMSDFIWLSIQAGYIYAYRFNVDSGNDYRSFGSDMPYVMENEMKGAPFFQISLNLVSP